MGLPIVTAAGRFMRGRHCHAILTRLGVTETIAADCDEYVDIAVALALDPERRRGLVARMQQSIDLLYEDPEPVRALESFYLKAVQSC